MNLPDNPPDHGDLKETSRLEVDKITVIEYSDGTFSLEQDGENLKVIDTDDFEDVFNGASDRYFDHLFDTRFHILFPALEIK